MYATLYNVGILFLKWLSLFLFVTHKHLFHKGIPMRHFALLSIALTFILTGCSVQEHLPPKKYDSEFPTESFIRKYLLTEENLIQTNMTHRNNEFLSESIGLYLLFLVQQKRETEFAHQVDVLTHYFLDDSNLVSWRLEKTNEGIVQSPANAWIDDARIVHALYKGAETFRDPSYSRLAKRIAKPLTTKATKNGLPVDYMDLSTNETGDILTLSYLDEAAIRLMPSSYNLYDNSKQILKNAPLSKPFFAKAYSITDQFYQFDDEINMIDQLYVALRYEQFGLSTDDFYAFFKETFNKGPVYGRYDRKTKEATVSYESQAVYALAVIYLLERDERTFADKVMERLKSFMVSDSSSEFYGGYLDVSTQETHSFDNLLPLLAEGGLLDGYLIP